MPGDRPSLCLLTALLAFVLGLTVGVMIPLYVLPRHAARPPTHLNASAVRVASPPSVTFVPRVPPPAVPRSREHVTTTTTTTNVAIYWDDRVEELLPRGFGDDDAESWRRFSRKTPVVKVEEGCGRMQNRLLTFEDGTRSCCRYRQNTDQIQGELFSFFLGRLLGLRNLVPSSLSVVRLRDAAWARVRPQLALAQWGDDRPVVLTRFVADLEPAHVPSPLRPSDRRLHPPDVRGLAPSQLLELAQWSDLVVFDYLTANLDRVVNNLYNLQWNPAMMEAPAHNLARDPSTGLLVFLDNESGLLHGYRLLDKYEQYHAALLQALCVFRKPTADAVRRLHRDGNVGALLQQHFEGADPALRDVLPPLPDKSVKILNERLQRVADQIAHCERLYSRVL